MDKNDQKKIEALRHRIGLNNHLTDAIIKEITDAPYKMAEEVIKELDLSDIVTEEDLDDIKTNFYFKGLGKLHIPFRRVDRKNKQQKSIKISNKKRWKN
tara:strand:+ start:19735 stop:20031 length:297 start_codon:yes stop_codon:yes gene_type:complete